VDTSCRKIWARPADESLVSVICRLASKRSVNAVGGP
jgi:hypothetical protein